MDNPEDNSDIIERQLGDLVLKAEDVEDVALSDVEDEDEDEEDYVARPIQTRSKSYPSSPSPPPPSPSHPPPFVHEPIYENEEKVDEETNIKKGRSVKSAPPKPAPVKKPRAKGKATQKVFQLVLDNIEPELVKYKPGFFISKTNKLAAKKCFTQICRSEYNNEACSVVFCLQEVNKNDANYWFQGHRIARPNPTITKKRIGDKTVEYVNKFQNVVTVYDPEGIPSSDEEDYDD